MTKKRNGLHFMIFGLAFLLLAPATTWASATACDDESQYSQVNREELETLIKKKAVFVIDVNSKESFAKNHIPTAIHFGTEKAELAKKLPTDKKALIVAYCGGPQCTAWQMAAEEACKLGYSNIRHYKGGLKGWFKKS